MMKRPNPLVFTILMLAALAAGCTPYWEKDRAERYAKCPDIRLLQPARGWIDPATADGWNTRGEITEFATQCKLTKTAAVITITASLNMERSQTTADDFTWRFPMFVATLRGDQIINKQILSAPVKFSADKKQAETEFEIPVSLAYAKVNDASAAPTDKDAKDKDKKPKDNLTAADRTLLLGFQLSPAQEAYFEKLREPQFPKP